MKIIDGKKCRRGVILAITAIVVSAVPASLVRAQSSQGTQAPTYGIPPSANTQRALSNAPGVSKNVLSGFYASLGVALGWTDNALRVPSQVKESDTVVVILPALGFKTDVGRHEASIDYSGYGESFQDFDNLSAMDNRLRAAMDFDFTEKLDAGIFAGYADVNERRGNPGSQVLQIEPNEVEITDYGAMLTYGTDAAKHMRLRIGADVEDWRYQNNDQEFRDRDTNGAFGEIHYNATAKTSVFLLGTYRDFEYTQANATTSDSDETTLQGGVEWRATEKTIGRISVGTLDKDFKDPSVPDEDTLTYTARIHWQPQTRTGVNLYGSRRTEETNSALDNFYLSTLWGLSVDHSFADRWSGDVYYNGINDDYDSGRDDKFHDFGIGVHYAFRRWLSLGARYGYIKRDSNIPINNYEENYFAFTLQANYQQY
jgi:hypothetical protein